jgi:hypothetical protein
MRRIVLWAVAGILAAGVLSAQNEAANTRITLTELRGEVARVQITPGEGMPFVELKNGDQVKRVYLGSMRYLMMQGFNPKVGDSIVAKVYKANHGLFAASMSLPARNITLRLRDDYGRPVWRRRAGG